MASDPVKLSQVPLPPTMGACLIGSYLSAVFYGVTLLQTYQYFNRYWGRDKIHLLILVVVLTLLDTFGVISNLYSMWFYLIKNFGNSIEILTVDWSLTFSLVSTALVAFIVQSFYAYRVWIVSERKLWLPVSIIVLALASLTLAIWYTILIFLKGAGSLLYIPIVTFLPTSALACSLGADTLIASSMVIYLLKGRRMGMKKTEGIINKLIIYTINTGVITTTCTIIILVMGEALSMTLYNIILNAREALRANESMTIELSIQQSTKQSSEVPTSRNGRAISPFVAGSSEVLSGQSKSLM